MASEGGREDLAVAGTATAEHQPTVGSLDHQPFGIGVNPVAACQ